MEQPFGKFLMFRNRLEKVYRHLSKQAKKQNITCYRVYDHDLPEFPFLIEFYEENLYVSEYRRRHNLTDEEHEQWLEECKAVMSEVLHVAPEHIFLKLRQKTDLPRLPRILKSFHLEPHSIFMAFTGRVIRASR